MDIEIYRTCDENERMKIRRILLGNQLSFSEKWEKIPFIKRAQYGGKKEMCVIYISDYYKDRIEEICSLMEEKEEVGVE